MNTIACGMMEDITKAYCDNGSKLARSVYTRDVQLNDINHNATQIVMNFCKNHPDDITNIAEDIIFYKEAKVLKHTQKTNTDD